MNISAYRYQITVIGILFAVIGLVTWLNGILIPFLKKSCELTDQQAYYVATAFFAAYFVMALPSSWILARLGTKLGMSIGLVIMAIGALLFLPAAAARSYPMFLGGLFILGTGLTLLQTAANPYASVLGPIESAATRISIMGVCNKFAGIIGNLFFGSVLLKNADAIQKQLEATTDPVAKAQLLDGLAARVETPYIGLAIFLIIIAAVIWKSSLPDISTKASDSGDGDTALSRGKTSIFQFPHVLLGALAIFMYVGAEVMAGDLITVYGKNLGFSEDQSKFFTSFGLIGLLLGYGASIVLIPKYIQQDRWLAISAIVGMLLSIISYFVSGSVAVGCIAALGFTNAVMWPAIFPLGIKNLGRFTNIGSALLVMGIVGGAIIPPFYGWLYDAKTGLGLNAQTGAGYFDFKSAFLVVMAPCYAYILYFALRGHRFGDASN